MACPKCQADDQIIIIVETQLLLTPEGCDPGSGDGMDEDWSEENKAICGGCGFTAKAKKFMVL